MPNPCRFCGATNRKITKEHVWPDWLKDFVPPSSGPGYAERWSSADGRQEWEQQLLSATVRKFCGGCNHGWMADIEGRAKPIVGPMAQAIPTTLDATAQEAIANWAVLKGLVATLVSRTPQPIPDSHYRRVCAVQGAPANTVGVWIGKRQNLAHPTKPGRAKLFDSHFMPVTNANRSGPIPSDLQAYIDQGGVFNCMIFAVGHFFAMVLQHDWPGLQFRPTPGSDAEQTFVSIWPVGDEVRWPPALPVDVLGNTHHVTQFFEMAPPLAPVYGP